MDRREKILFEVNRKGRGIEVGPSFAPIASKAAGFDVVVIDHLDQPSLQAKYKTHGVNIDNIEHVDFVWNGEKLDDLIGESHAFDYMIASHVIEHTPDLIGFLRDCSNLLKDDGILGLAIPDRRYCFDYFRSATSIGQVIDAHVAGHTNHSLGTIAEHHLTASALAGAIAWTQGATGARGLIHSYPTGAETRAFIENRQNIRKSGEYIDCHAWVFTPSVFALLINDLNMLGYIDLHVLHSFDSEGYEFIVGLSRNAKPPQLSRLELMQKCIAEQAQTL
jgi:2-polyprenyl-3-methyl-5-hydroxy-6-metoxy-1,4-benzoquinol methylase